MMSRYFAILPAIALTAALVGCQQPRPSDMTLQRGSQLLAAGSPKSAIPFLTQTIASTPDGPEPVALLSLAYALDQQADRAIAQARQVHRPSRAAPGWEAVAVGIAEMVRRRPNEAQANLQRVATRVNPDEPVGLAARQWLALAHVLSGENEQALETLQALAEQDRMRTSAMLWSVLIQARQGQVEQASDALKQSAAGIVDPRKPALDGKLQGQALYDRAVTAIAAGNFDSAQAQLLELQQQPADSADSAVWLALITAARGDWQAGHEMLKQASRVGPIRSRGLANQLLAVTSALEDRPDAMIEHMLTGQRMLGRNATPTYIVEQPKPESVWFSDAMKWLSTDAMR